MDIVPYTNKKILQQTALYDEHLPPPPSEESLMYGNASQLVYGNDQLPSELPRLPPRAMSRPNLMAYDSLPPPPVEQSTAEDENIYEGISPAQGPLPPLPSIHTLGRSGPKKSLPAIPVEQPPIKTVKDTKPTNTTIKKTISTLKPKPKAKSIPKQKSSKQVGTKLFQFSKPLVLIHGTFTVLYTMYYIFITLVFFEVIE